MSLFACPICGERLDRLEKAYVCPNGHSYDIASEGYVYLLPPNKKHSKMPGDDKAMVASRRRFLESGCYRIFSDALNNLALKYYPADGSAIVDAGCGEGYYTSRLAEFFSEHGMNPPLCGFDISKFAVKAAAKKYRSIPFAVGKHVRRAGSRLVGRPSHKCVCAHRSGRICPRGRALWSDDSGGA
jgi:23S rRNA (guanine745-N1)-methyltransferase